MNPVQQNLTTLFGKATILSARVKEVSRIVDTIVFHKDRYDEVTETLKSVPWWAVAVIHNMECSLDFTKHLHNGDSLKRRTINVPKGRPVGGKEPFTWLESAIDALRYDGAHVVTDWTIGPALDWFERYNGVGYRKRGVPSPYLWSFTDRYVKGKFVKDGKYSATAVSQQAGIACLLKELQKRGLVKF